MADIKITDVFYFGDKQFYRLSVDGVFLQVNDDGADGTVDSVCHAYDLEQWRLVQAFFEKYQKDIQRVVARFREELPQELKNLKSRLGEPSIEPRDHFLLSTGRLPCSTGECYQTKIQRLERCGDR